LTTLITGASGFAGGYLCRACADAGEHVVGVSRSGTVPVGCGERRAIDLRDQAAIRGVLREVSPDVVYHLASQSSVGRSWEDPTGTIEDNVSSAVNVLEALRLEAPDARVVWVSSCEVYGTSAKLPIDEEAPILPANPYAVSKAAGEMLAGVYAEAHGLRLVRARPFNHTGPGQRDTFIVSSFARQAAEARLAGERHVKIAMGNPRTRRDFTDVRDVARAYRLLASVEADPATYNVCSGHSISAAEQVRLLNEVLAPLEIEAVVDPGRVRAHEVMDLRGANARIRATTGWQPEIPFHRTVLETVQWWEAELRRAGGPVTSGR
jgi:GDP-4-dehydro-6-deoxy-D-mannose reductase